MAFQLDCQSYKSKYFLVVRSQNVCTSPIVNRLVDNALGERIARSNSRQTGGGASEICVLQWRHPRALTCPGRETQHLMIVLSLRNKISKTSPKTEFISKSWVTVTQRHNQRLVNELPDQHFEGDPFAPRERQIFWIPNSRPTATASKAIRVF